MLVWQEIKSVISMSRGKTHKNTVNRRCCNDPRKWELSATSSLQTASVFNLLCSMWLFTWVFPGTLVLWLENSLISPLASKTPGFFVGPSSSRPENGDSSVAFSSYSLPSRLERPPNSSMHSSTKAKRKPD